ncbi:MAG: NfeD family protein [Ignisphaera sp.]
MKFADISKATVFVLLAFSFTITLVQSSIANSQTGSNAVLIRIQGSMETIDVPTELYIKEALSLAEQRNVPLVVVVDSYGGYMDSMINIANAFLNARIPVLGYIADKAMSAASIIVQPMHIVGISPYGVIGAAQPISVNPVTGQYEFINESKIINSVVAMATRYAEARGRNSTAVVMFITKNLVLKGEEAVREKVVDVVANDLNDFIAKVNGRIVTVEHDGTKVNYTIDIAGLDEFSPPIYIQIYGYLRDPTVNSILWFIGFFGTFIALLSGRIDILPITIVFLLLALLGGSININIVAVMLIALGSLLIALEFMFPTHGLLGVGGIISLLFGVLLMPISPATQIAPSFIESVRTFAIILGGGLTGFFSFILYKAIEANRKRRRAVSKISNNVAKVVERIEPGKRGRVVFEGEYWFAESDDVLEPGEEVVVVDRKGFVLIVKKKKQV